MSTTSSSVVGPVIAEPSLCFATGRVTPKSLPPCGAVRSQPTSTTDHPMFIKNPVPAVPADGGTAVLPPALIGVPVAVMPALSVLSAPGPPRLGTS
jgi:hypothetical protein